MIPGGWSGTGSVIRDHSDNGRLRDGPLENLWGVGWGGQSTKKYSRKGKLNEKNSCTPINAKRSSCYGLKKIHTGNLITKKNSCGSKIPPPPTTPNNFSNGPSLNEPMNPSWTRIHHRHPKLKLWVCCINLLSYKRVGVASQETVETLYEK